MQVEMSGHLVIPPKGATMFDWEKPMSFGLKHMLHQSVEGPLIGGKREIFDGTTLVYDPGFIRVDIRRQDVSAEHINRIGQLAVEIQDNLTLQEYLKRISKEAERAMQAIRFLAGYTGGMNIYTADEEIDRKAAGIFEQGTGLSKAMLEERQGALSTRLLEITTESHAMGVVIFDRFSDWNHIVTPPSPVESSEQK